MNRTAGLIAVSTLILAGCGPQPVKDSAVLDALRMDRPGFEQAVGWMNEKPAIQSVDRRSDGSVTTVPANVDARRVQGLERFMGRHGITHVGSPPDGGKVGFVMSGSGLGVSGQAKSLVYSQVAPNDGPLVADTDVEMAKPSERWRVVRRSVGDGWYIENSCC